jgi:hypothetical protein
MSLLTFESGSKSSPCTDNDDGIKLVVFAMTDLRRP